MNKKNGLRIIALFFVLGISQITFGQNLEVQGHRGARGLFPENSIPGFLKAIELGVSTLEMDVVISKDGVVVVSHEPYLNSEICLDTLNHKIRKAEQKQFNLFTMHYAQIAKCDCGSIKNENFPNQENFFTKKPTLLEVIQKAEAYCQANGIPPIQYNIELKSSEAGDGIFHPAPADFSNMVYAELENSIGLERVTIQSFDFRVLRYWNEQYPQVSLAALVYKKGGVKKHLDTLGFVPDIYSCYYKLLSKKEIKTIHAMGMRVIPWTVNQPRKMKKLIRMGVDGIITDYPDRLIALQKTSNSTNIK